MDLDSATVISNEQFNITQGSDIRIAYHADRSNHAALVLVEKNVNFPLLTTTTFASVTLADTIGLTFSTMLDSLPDNTATVIVQTDTGAFFKLGNIIENATLVIFNNELLK